jgi:hypothetical protein
MARTGHDDQTTRAVLSIDELHGRPVWSEAGDRLGVVRDVVRDADDRLVALQVRERWMFGARHEIPTAGMRLDGGDVIVPQAAVEMAREREAADRRAEESRGAGERELRHERERQRQPVRPVLLAGRPRARGRFGGIDGAATFVGALVAIAALVLLGGIVAAALGMDPTVIDTAYANFQDVASEAMIVGALVTFAALFLGGWAAGRSSRFDGVRNGAFVPVWVLAIALVLGGLGAWLGDQYDVWEAGALPTFVTGEFALWGTLAFLATFVLMVVAGGLGGALGDAWHRRLDRSMLDVVVVDDGANDVAGNQGSRREGSHQEGSRIKPSPFDVDRQRYSSDGDETLGSRHPPE